MSTNMNYGPLPGLPEEIHSSKYRGEGETFFEFACRVANALKDNELHFRAFRGALLEQRFLPAGRVQAAMGAPRTVTPYNCFVSGTIPDSMDGIMIRAAEAAQTMRLGGGIGYDFSTLRPRGDKIVSLDSTSSGPLSFMDIFDSICRTICSAGHRRGAMMGVLRVDHPDIELFVRAKQNSDKLTGFNISIGVTDEFMNCVVNGSPFPLRFGGRVYKQIDAQALWEEIMRSTWDWAEPGVLFIDRINAMNNLSYCETIAATNPCAEQPLPPFGACLLGSFNLTKYLFKDRETGKLVFAYHRLIEDIPHVVRAMDNVVDRAVYPLPEQEAEAKAKRRMGLGVTGLANAAEALGYPYGSEAFITFQNAVLNTIKEESYRASALLAKEKGAFSLFQAEDYLKAPFIQSLTPYTRDLIKKHGIRNSHLTSIAPTGTISLAAGNVSSSIEPVFAYWFDRTLITFDGPRTERVFDYGYNVLGVKGKRTHELSADDHLRVLLTATNHVDSAVSKTCNVNPKMPWDEFKSVYMRAWLGGAKGCTTFNPEGKRYGILNATTEDDEGAACYIDPNTGKKTCE